MTDQILDSLRPLAVAIDTLQLDPRNARTHPERNVVAIARSLAEFGQRKPIVVQRQGLVVRAGNGAVLAARSLGWTQIAAVVVDEGDVRATAYAIADNRTAELAEWDDALLAELLGALRDDPDVDQLVTGFTEQEISRICGRAGGAADADEIPEPPAKPRTKPGDLWVLGEHRLLCGDSTVAADVERLLEGAKPRLLLTDPPYGVELDMEARGHTRRRGRRRAGHQNTQLAGDDRADWSQAFELVPSLDTAYVWHASAYAIEVGQGLRRIGFELKQQIIWRKPRFALSRQHYHWQHEPAWYARKAKALPFRGSRDQATIWDAASPKMLMTGSTEEKLDHPTQKPVALYMRPIENHLEEGEAFYEPFSGSGTALAAAELARRRCLAMELDPKYVDVAVARWERLTGRTAVVVAAEERKAARRGEGRASSWCVRGPASIPAPIHNGRSVGSAPRRRGRPDR